MYNIKIITKRLKLCNNGSGVVMMITANTVKPVLVATSIKQ